MADTTFVDGTVVQAAWLNDVNDLVYAFPSLTVTGVKKLINTNGTLSFVTDSSGSAGNGLSVDDYGGDPTGVADSSAALDAAWAAMPDGGLIYFTAGGTYKLSTSVLDGKNGTISAVGAVINCTSASGAITKSGHGYHVHVDGGRWFGADGAVCIYYNASPTPSDQLVEFSAQNAYFSSLNNFAVKLIGCRETFWSNCSFTTESSSTNPFCGGVYCSEANNPYFIECSFNGKQKGYGFLADGQGSPSSANPTLIACEFLGWDVNVKIVANDDFNITNCTIDYGVSGNVVISSQDTGRITGGYLGGGIDGVSNIPALTFTSEGNMSYGPDLCRFITVSGVNFANHQFTGSLMDLVLLTGPSSAYYPQFIVFQGNHFYGYTRYGINFSTIAQLTIDGNTFTPDGAASEPTSSPIYNATGTGDSLVLITNNQFPNPTTLSGSALSSANIFNNPGMFSTSSGANSIVMQRNGNCGVGGFGTSYWHWVDQKGAIQLDRYANPATFRGRSASGTYSVPTTSGSTDTVLNIIGDARNSSGSFVNVGSYQVKADGSQTGTSSPGRLVLATTAASSTSMVSRMEVDAAGNVFLNPTGVASSGRIYFGGSTSGTATNGIFYGGSTPEAAVTAPPGSIYLSSAGSLYVKATGTGNTGWSSVSGSARSYVRVNTSATVFTSGGAFTKVTFSVEAVDTLNEWTSNTFTAAATGDYSINCSIAVTGAAYALNEQTRVDIYKNGTRILAGQAVPAQAAVTFNSTTSISAVLELTAGDTIEFYVFNNCTGGATAANGNAIATWATIARVH